MSVAHIEDEEYGRVNSEGHGIDSIGGVRPVLTFVPVDDVKVGMEVDVANERWIVISENMMLCERTIIDKSFNDDFISVSDANDYEKSTIKNFLDTWYEMKIQERTIRPLSSEEMVNEYTQVANDLQNLNWNQYSDDMTEEEQTQLEENIKNEYNYLTDQSIELGKVMTEEERLAATRYVSWSSLFSEVCYSGNLDLEYKMRLMAVANENIPEKLEKYSGFRTYIDAPVGNASGSFDENGRFIMTSCEQFVNIGISQDSVV